MVRPVGGKARCVGFLNLLGCDVLVNLSLIVDGSEDHGSFFNPFHICTCLRRVDQCQGASSFLDRIDYPDDG